MNLLILHNDLPLILNPPHVTSLMELHIEIPNIILFDFCLHPLLDDPFQAAQVRIGELDSGLPAQRP